MKLRIMSDFHSEFLADRQHKIPKILDKSILPLLDTDADSILILAGDMGSLHYPKALVKTIDHIAPRFKHVLYLPGNHEYYGGDIQEGVANIHKLIKHHDNLIFDNFEKVPFEYLGEPTRRNDVWMATLWSDYLNGNPVHMLACQGAMNDYKHIKGFSGELPVTPDELLKVHNYMRENLAAGIKFGDVVITHHLPSFLSVPNHFKNSEFNGAYVSEMSHIIEDKNPVLWVHGHTHDVCDYNIGMTRVICNPAGYHPNYTKQYNNKLVIEV